MRSINMYICVWFLVSMFAAGPAWSAPKPLGNPKAPSGGTFYANLDAEPTTLNPFTASDGYATAILGYVQDSLMVRDVETFEFVPALAEKVDEAKDGKSITFYLRKDAVFADGKPVTAEDVKFSYDAIMDPAYNAAVLRTFYENFSGVDIVDPHTVRFNIKKKYFLNLSAAAGLSIVPKHMYGDPKKKMNKVVYGSGAYSLEKYDQGNSIVLVKNPKWWGFKNPYFKGYYHFERLHFRFLKEENARLELIKRGQLDFLELKPEQYVLKTSGAPWGATVKKEQVTNSTPKRTNFIGWNLKNDLFKDRDVRLALTHLYDRVGMSKKFYFDMAIPATGPWYQQSMTANPKTKAIPFDPKKAKELLAKAGWIDSDKDGILDKMIDGKKRDFRFSLLLANKDAEKYFTVYKEELKKSGIEMGIVLVEWNAFVKKLEDRGFDAVAMAWGGVVDGDPKQIWHTESQRAGGSNFVGYSNPKVDALIDKAREELDAKKRHAMVREIYDMVAKDVPYVFLVNMKYDFYAYSSKVERPQPTFKYSIGTDMWWSKAAQ